MNHRILKSLLVTLGVLLLPLWAQAQMATEPLLTKGGNVESNLVLMYDDSASMPAGFLYQFGGNPGVFGMTGPDSNFAPPPTNTRAYRSPDINQMYYDPRILYKLRINADGTTLVAGTPSTITFNVFFYKGTYPTSLGAPYPQVWTTPTLAISYHNPYTPPAAEVVAGSTATYPNAVATGGGPFPKFINRSDCVASATSCSLAEERQNYANWLLYHSNRQELTRTGIGLAFQSLPATFRMGWGTINKMDGGAGVLDAGVAQYNPATKTRFFNWLYSNATDGTVAGTPNRLALQSVGKYFQRTDSDGPWGTTPRYTSTSQVTPGTVVSSEATSAHASCRRSFAMLVTDGYYNDAAPTWAAPAPPSTNIDGSIPPQVANKNNAAGTFQPVFPYPDTRSNTLSDMASFYWSRDLRTDLPNAINSGSAFWQNLTFYGITLGLYGTLKQDAPTLAALKATPSSWPAPTINNPTAIDDMWHAAINTGGRYLSAKNADDLINAVAAMSSEINRASSSQSGVAVSTANLTVGTRKYTPRYSTVSWVGDIDARNLDPNTGTEINTAWQLEGIDPITLGPTASMIPLAAARNIWVGNAATSAPRAVTFTFTAMSSASLTASMTGTVNAALINYLRGDMANEQDDADNPLGIYRRRSTLPSGVDSATPRIWEGRMGDVVNSSPVLVKGGTDLKYQGLPVTYAPAGSYDAFLASKATREGVLYVGANDGMLHGFRDGLGANDGGTEIFAYVPRAVLPNLGLLANPSYVHTYYVDGPNVETDAYWTGAWRNVLLGTTGAGAKAVFAIDVTTPFNAAAAPNNVAMNASNVLWEVNSGSTGFSELGHVLTDVQSGPLINGQWVAIFGNGYFSASGTARLFVVNLQTGALIKEINTGVGGGNGLGGVRVVRDAQKRIIGAYGGDLKGNLWKFDLSDLLAVNWRVGLGGVPVYSAGATKPITAAPGVLTHPSGGYVVAAASGKFYENTDLTNLAQQTVYGIWDSVAFGSTTLPGVTLTGTASLVQQTISAAITVTQVIVSSVDLSTSTQVVSFFSVSTNPVDWTTKKGWYINLPNSGQRVVFPVETLAGSVIAVDSISPISAAGAAGDPCSATNQGAGWVYLIDGLTGQGPPASILDTNGDGAINDSDLAVSGFSSLADGRNTSLKIISQSTVTVTALAIISGGSGSAVGTAFDCRRLGAWGSFSCTAASNQGIRTREWRQLFMR